jgi:integrase
MPRKRRADGRMQVQIDLGVIDGKRRRKYFYGKTLKEAREARDAWKAEQERRARVIVADADVTVAQWSAMWVESIKGTVQDTTYKARESAIREQNAFTFKTSSGSPALFGSMRVIDVRPIHVQTYMRSLAEMSKGTISMRRFVLKSILNAAVANSIIDRSPWQDIKSPRGTYKGHRALDDDEQKMIRDTWDGHRAGIWALSMLYTGMRREELAALDVADIDFSAGQIRIHAASVLKERGRIKETKTEAGNRTIPILAPLLEPLRAFVGGKKSGAVFVSAAGEPLAEIAYKRAWESYMRYLNLCAGGTDAKRTKNENGKAAWIPAKIVTKPFTAHDLRYTYATILYDAGVDVKTAAVLLGHSDITVTMKIYTQLSVRKQQQGIDALVAYANGIDAVQTGAKVANENG